MKSNESMIGNNPSVKVSIQSAYKEGDKFVANVGLGMIDGSVCWFECVWMPSFPVNIATGRHSVSVIDEIRLLKQFIKDNESAIKAFAEAL
jgi:hypothetical protein